MIGLLLRWPVAPSAVFACAFGLAISGPWAGAASRIGPPSAAEAPAGAHPAALGSDDFEGDGMTDLAASGLDIAADQPPPQSGRYYLVRPRICGSWQSSLGSEPGRDMSLP